MATKETIYVALLDEGVDVWRPVEAIHEHDDVYSIVSVNSDPEDEHWQFHTGEAVRCRRKTFEGGATGMVAYEKA